MMKPKEIVQKTLQRNGNLSRLNSIYITQQNMIQMSQDVSSSGVMPDILITPYLISNDGNAVYELHYYEFDIDIKGNKSYYINHNINNTLPAEIVDNIKPKAIVAEGDIQFYVTALSHYLSAMSKMYFKEDRDHYPQLHNALLYYQIFMDEVYG